MVAMESGGQQGRCDSQTCGVCCLLVDGVGAGQSGKEKEKNKNKLIQVFIKPACA